MSTSGQTVLELTGDEIINAAYRKLVVIGLGQTANAQQITDGRQALNNIVAEYRTLGMSIWARREVVVPTVTGQSQYVFGIGQAINIPYPLKIYQITLEQPPLFSIQQDVNLLGFMDFGLLPEDSQGTVVNAMYQPAINKGTLSVWPTPDASMIPGTRMRVTYQTPFEYFVSGVDTPDFPEEWKNALIYQLALSLSDENGVSTQKQQWLEKQAEKHLAIALSAGTEEASMYFQRDWAGSY